MSATTAVIERQALVSRQHWRELRRGDATLVPEPFGVLSVAVQAVVVRGVAPPGLGVERQRRGSASGDGANSQDRDWNERCVFRN